MTSENTPPKMKRTPFYEGSSSKEAALFHEDITRDLQPWTAPKDSVTKILKEWKETGEPLIREAFKKRDKEKARPLMVNYTARYIQAMIWAKGEPVTDLIHIERDIGNLQYAPVNIEERLSFVINTPAHHHAFITLSQLFDESKKKWAVYFLKSGK
ncbi:YpoC family protein [Alteribacter keqinensis]|uniref:YpoC-like domain-containing protein n=1 Tax=Alteribacter keqinensis TaxID=2483800 RepID=A0A3M7TUP9_9BACI|nr:hypothetical protein [Alteribacter keqinensis]RNA69183.1 hypothetical protein EBO34_04330 [Alteribacter keqinensis]